MEVMTMHNASNMHAMRVPSQPCDANALRMQNCLCMQIPSHAELSPSLSLAPKDAKVVGGINQHPHAPKEAQSEQPKEWRQEKRNEGGYWYGYGSWEKGRTRKVGTRKARLGTPTWNLVFMGRWYQVSKVCGENQAISAIKHAGMGWPSPCQRTQWTH